MRVLQLTAANVKRLVAVEIKPGANVVEIRGANAAGKSSVLDSIAFALGGKGLCPDKPIRDGETKAEVTVVLDDLTVKRTWTGKGSYLSVTTGSGAVVKSPQAILDKLAGALTFDPLEFSRKKPPEQREELLSLVGLTGKLTELDTKHADAFERRRGWKKEVDRLDKERNAIEPAPPDTPDLMVVVADLMQELEAAQAEREAKAELKQQADRLGTLGAQEVEQMRLLEVEIGNLIIIGGGG